MTSEPGYPVTLVHPSHMPARLAIDDQIGAPERFPAVVVHGTADEALYRSKGYLRFGEPQTIKTDHHEYPKMLRHPGFVPAVQQSIEGKLVEGRIVTYTVPAVPAKFPDVTVRDADEEARWIERGYKVPGEYNRAALEAVLNGTEDEETYEPDEYPKWVDGKLVARDPDVDWDDEPSSEYPKYVNGVIVHDPRFPQAPDPSKYPMWVHRDGKPSDASILVKTPQEEFEVRSKWKKEERAESETESAVEVETSPGAVLPAATIPEAKIPSKPSPRSKVLGDLTL